jgi:membrane protein implicated in regulation of membrane protease activity
VSAVIWLVLGVALLVAELLHTAFVFVWFGASALLVALAAALGLDSIAGELVLFAVVSTSLVLASRTIFKRFLPSRGATRSGAAALPGAIATVGVAIDNAAGTGRVDLHGLDWAARSLSGEPIPAGRRVQVIEVQGVTLVVEEEPGSANVPSPGGPK